MKGKAGFSRNGILAKQVEIKLNTIINKTRQFTNGEIDFNNLVGTYKQVNEIIQQEIPKERIVYMGVDEWKKNNYGFASKIVLDISPGGK